jgi:Flp pilus assembly protein TadB
MNLKIKMKMYKKQWKKKEAWPPWQKQKETKKGEEIKKTEEKNEEVAVQIDAKAIADLISKELLKQKQFFPVQKTQISNSNSNSFKDDKLLLILVFLMSILAIFVIIISIISLVISIQSSSAIKAISNIL